MNGLALGSSASHIQDKKEEFGKLLLYQSGGEVICLTFWIPRNTRAETIEILWP